MRQTRAVMTTLLVLLTLLLAPTVRAAEEFSDPEGRFTFLAPEGFDQLTADEVRDLARSGGAATAANNVVVLYRDPVTMANVSVGATAFGTRNTSAQEGAEEITRFLGSADSVALDPEGIREATIAGEDARWYGYTITDDTGAQLRGQQYLMFRDGTAYFITFTALRDDFDGFFDRTRGILDTFAFR